MRISSTPAVFSGSFSIFSKTILVIKYFLHIEKCCRVCHITILHITSGCSNLAQTHYISNHNKVANVVEYHQPRENSNKEALIKDIAVPAGWKFAT